MKKRTIYQLIEVKPWIKLICFFESHAVIVFSRCVGKIFRCANRKRKLPTSARDGADILNVYKSLNMSKTFLKNL